MSTPLRTKADERELSSFLKEEMRWDLYDQYSDYFMHLIVVNEQPSEDYTDISPRK